MRGVGGYNGHHIQPRAKVVRQGQDSAGETPQLRCHISH